MSATFLPESLVTYSPLIALLALVLALAALAWGSTASRRARRALERLGELEVAGAAEGLTGTVLAHKDQLALHAAQLESLENNQQALRRQLAGCFQRSGLVRYDAFGDMGGKLSFSLALLDEEASGLVISALIGREQTRVYAKPIEKGHSEFSLSEEEKAACAQALEVGR